MQHEVWQVEPDEGSYGLGLIGKRVGDRLLWGHSGGYPGHITRTLFDPQDRLAVSVFTNAIDGPAGELAEGVVRLVDLAARQDAPDADAATRARFTGRYANLWGVLDVADLGGRLFALDPGEAEPARTRPRCGSRTTGALRDRRGQPRATTRRGRADFTFDGDGAVKSVQGGGGTSYRPLAAHTRALAGLDRVRQLT